MESVEKGDDETALKSLIDLAETCPKYLRPQLDQLIAACIKIFSDKEQVGKDRGHSCQMLEKFGGVS